MCEGAQAKATPPAQVDIPYPAATATRTAPAGLRTHLPRVASQAVDDFEALRTVYPPHGAAGPQGGQLGAATEASLASAGKACRFERLRRGGGPPHGGKLHGCRGAGDALHCLVAISLSSCSHWSGEEAELG